MRESLPALDWEFSEEEGELTITHAGFVIGVEIHAWDIVVEYSEETERETYLCKLSSDCLAWKKTELEHKRLMREVFKRLLWRKKVAGWIEGNQLMVVASTNIEGKEWDPFLVTPQKWQECPIPEKLERPRRRLLRMKPPTSYLGTRIKS